MSEAVWTVAVVAVVLTVAFLFVVARSRTAWVVAR